MKPHRSPAKALRGASFTANELKPWLKEQYCLPEAPSSEFVYHMEDVLDVYTRA